MSTLPNRPAPPAGEPPAVAYVRERIADARVVRWARRHRTPAAVLGGLIVTFKAWLELDERPARIHVPSRMG